MLLELFVFAKRLLKKYSVNSLTLLFPQLIAFSLALITIPIILSSLPISDYGTLQFVVAIQLWLLSLTGSNISVGAKNAISRGYGGTFLFAFIYRIKLHVIIGLLGLCAGMAAYFFHYVLLAKLMFVIFGYVIVGNLANESYDHYFIAKKEFKKMASWDIAIIIMASIISTIVAVAYKNIFFYALAQYGTTAVISWLAMAYIIKKNNLVTEYKKRNIDKSCIHFGLKLIPSQIVNLSATKISSFIIGPFFGYANLSLFYVANNLRDKFASVVRIINPLLYSDFAQHDKSKLLQLIMPKMKLFVMFSTLFTVAASITGYLYINLLLPEAYQEAKIYFIILAVMFPASIISFLLSTVFESQLLHKELMISQMSVDILKIALILLGGLLGGIMGICIGIALSGWAGLLILYVMISKKRFS